MKYAIIKNQKVLNIIEADEANAGRIADSMGAIAVQSDIAGIGQSYSNGVFENIPIIDNHQELKSLKLKQAENSFLAIVMTVPNVAIGDNSDVLTAKIEASELTETQKLSLGLKLLNAIHEVELQGGSWHDLPSVPHVIE